MSATAIGFFLSAAVATIAALVGLTSRRVARSLAGVGVALGALLVPLLQLRAPTVAVALMLAAGIVVALLAGLARLEPSRSDRPAPTPVYWVFAGAGLLGFVWVLFATGSRQVVEQAPILEPGAAFGDGTGVFTALVGEHVVAALIVGLLALCSVIAAVLTLVAEAERPAGETAPSHANGS